MEALHRTDAADMNRCGGARHPNPERHFAPPSVPIPGNRLGMPDRLRTLMGPAAQVTPRAPHSAEASAAPDTETDEQTKGIGAGQRPDATKGVREGPHPNVASLGDRRMPSTQRSATGRVTTSLALLTTDPVGTKSAELPVQIASFEC